MRKYPQGLKSFNMTQYLSDLKKQNYRIIIGDFYEGMARFVLCEAYHQGMTGNQVREPRGARVGGAAGALEPILIPPFFFSKEIVWFIPRWFPDNWYDVDQWNNKSTSAHVHCTTQQMLEGLQGHMSLSYKYYADDDKVTPENESVRHWRQRYKMEVGLP